MYVYVYILQTHKEEARKVYENEQMRLEYIQELKRRFEDEKRTLETEVSVFPSLLFVCVMRLEYIQKLK